MGKSRSIFMGVRIEWEYRIKNKLWLLAKKKYIPCRFWVDLPPPLNRHVREEYIFWRALSCWVFTSSHRCLKWKFKRSYLSTILPRPFIHSSRTNFNNILSKQRLLAKGAKPSELLLSNSSLDYRTDTLIGILTIV